MACKPDPETQASTSALSKSSGNSARGLIEQLVMAKENNKLFGL
jgi:hypothetical protein